MFTRNSTLASLLLLSLTGSALAQQGPESVLRGTKLFKKSVVISGLAGPWEVTYGPDNMLWVTERTGKRVTRVDPATGQKTVAGTIEEVSAPGGQDGLLGMALHPELLKGTGNDYVYVYFTGVDEAKGAVAAIADPKSAYRYLYGKVVRFTYSQATGKLTSPVNVITGIPAGNDHTGGRVKFGPDKKLYLTVGDRGNNQLGNYCQAIESQRLPTAQELKEQKYESYVGKSLRLNLDGSVPADNPAINGLVSHVFTYGHRNPQGLDFAPDGTIYESEHGPKTDDELNILKPGGNYGWPHVAGLKDNKAFEYARWAEAKTPCAQLRFTDLAIHPSVPRERESAFKKPMNEPLATMFTVPTGFNFSNPVCKGIDYICWPTVGASSVEHYMAKGIPGWDRVLLVTTLKRGSLYVQPLKANGQAAAGPMSRYFQSENRFRDTAVSADGKTIYVATDPGGLAESRARGTTTRMQDPGAILAFAYMGEGSGPAPEEPTMVSEAPAHAEPVVASGHTMVAEIVPQFSAAQVAAGKTAYNANCAVCHGSTMTNGTFGTPLAGEYFKTTWFGQTVRKLYDRAQKTMPPASPSSLPKETYANILAYVLEFNGFKPGAAALPAGGDELDKMSIK